MMNRIMSKKALFVMLTLLAACGRHNTPEEPVGTFPDEETVAEMYNYFIAGDYAKYVDQMESLDSKPQWYRSQMADLMKQKHRQQEEDRGGPQSCRVINIEPFDTAYCNAFIEVTYKDHSYEQIIMELVKKNGEWRLK